MGDVNWWKSIPEINNYVEIKYLVDEDRQKLCLSFLELEALVHEETKDI